MKQWLQGVVVSIRLQAKVLLVVTSCTLLAVSITYILYNHTANLLKQRLQERIVAIVSTAAQEIAVNDIQTIRNTDDLERPETKRIVSQLERVRAANSDITYAYLMRRTGDLNIFEFIADADSLDSLSDSDGDGKVEDEDDDLEAPMPGDPFDVSEYPTLRDEAFFHPVAANELEEDEWSIQLSAYAPIIDNYGESVAIVGIDIVVEDFRAKTQAMLTPFLLFIIFLVFLITLLTLILIRFYNERVEAFRELDRQKDELLGMVSHQFATPISALKWDIEMLLDGDFGALKSVQKEFIQKLQGVSAHLSDLASMILDVSRIQLGKMKVDRVELNIKEFFDEEMALMKAKAHDKKIDLKASIGKGVTTGNLDKRLMRMIVQNLLSNAIKYTPDGGTVSLNAEVKNKTLLFKVSDTGCGIPVRDQKNIFGKLFRASNVRDIDGNGFGLYVVKGAVEAQNGKVWFKSVEGKGTLFYVDLPLVDGHETK